MTAHGKRSRSLTTRLLHDRLGCFLLRSWPSGFRSRLQPFTNGAIEERVRRRFESVGISDSINPTSPYGSVTARLCPG